MDLKNSYTTSDLYFAAYLKVACVLFMDTTREGNKVIFHFDPGTDPSTMRELKRQYFSGVATVSALDLTQAIKWAKSLTHQG